MKLTRHAENAERKVVYVLEIDRKDLLIARMTETDWNYLRHLQTRGGIPDHLQALAYFAWRINRGLKDFGKSKKTETGPAKNTG